MKYNIGQNVEFKIDKIINSNGKIKTKISLIDDPYTNVILYVHSSQKIFNKYQQNTNITLDKDEIFRGWISRINRYSITICLDNFGREKPKLYFAVFYIEIFNKLKEYILSAVDKTINIDELELKYFSRVSEIIVNHIKGWKSTDYYLLYQGLNINNENKLGELGDIMIKIRTELSAYNQGNIYDRDIIIGGLKELYSLGFVEHIDSLLRYIDSLYDGISVKEFMKFKEEKLNLSYFYKFKEICSNGFPNDINIKERYNYVNKIRNKDYIKNMEYDEIDKLLKCIGAKNTISRDMINQMKVSLEYIVSNENIDSKIKTLTQKKGLNSLTVCRMNEKESGLTKEDIGRLIIYLNPKESYLFDDESLIALKLLGFNPKLSKSHRKANREFMNSIEGFNIIDTYIEIVGKQTDYYINYEIEEFLKYVAFSSYNDSKLNNDINNKIEKICKDIKVLKIKFKDELKKVNLYTN